MDALGRGSNGQFEPLDKRNMLVGNAPVLIPPLWYTHDYDWVHTVAGDSASRWDAISLNRGARIPLSTS